MKIKNFTALVCMLFVAQFSIGQITLKHSYHNTVYLVYKQYGDVSAYKYLVTDTDNGLITIYNSDNSVYKTIKPQITNGKVFIAGALYTDVINSDPLLELYCTSSYKTASDNLVYDTYLINEEGEIIKKFENTNSLSVICVDSEFELFAYRTIENQSIYDIYSLGTRLSNIPIQSEKSGFPYPNPARHVINIPYQLSGQWGTISIYNASGQLIDQKTVGRDFSVLLLDISSYSKGMYYYKAVEQRGEFMVQ